MTTNPREAAAMNLYMHDRGTTYGEQLADQIIEQFKGYPKTTALIEQVAALTADNLVNMQGIFRSNGIGVQAIEAWLAAAELSYDARLGGYALTEVAEFTATLLADAAASLRKCATSYNRVTG
jgi:hypothetical protein